ncbi:MAG: T9SS type A sorting domain-containing protein, partial [Candidatus Marinimicrobia bacterium]|nr:T9SS type A sorting domain-containing protein [Candidatus Neomarinimicrobiota bacterium]
EFFDLSQNYPNPFNPTTVINYAIPQATEVTIVIYDLLGREVIRWEGNKIGAGYHSIRWDGRNQRGVQVSSGVYIYRIIAGDFIRSKKMVLLR